MTAIIDATISSPLLRVAQCPYDLIGGGGALDALHAHDGGDGRNSHDDDIVELDDGDTH